MISKDVSIDELVLSKRSRSVLANDGIETVGQLLAISYEAMWRSPNCGRKTLMDIHLGCRDKGVVWPAGGLVVLKGGVRTVISKVAEPYADDRLTYARARALSAYLLDQHGHIPRKKLAGVLGVSYGRVSQIIGRGRKVAEEIGKLDGLKKWADISRETE